MRRRHLVYNMYSLSLCVSLSLSLAVGRMPLQEVPENALLRVVGLVVQEAIEDVPHYMGSVAKVKSMYGSCPSSRRNM